MTIAAPAIPAREPTFEDMLGMDLAELVKIEVTSTTKGTGVDIRRAPGVVRVFTAADIERYGFRSLRDVLSHVPGVQINEYRGGHQLAFFRGVQSRYNNKILFLVDGVPLRDSYYGHMGIDEALPLGHVERVEIINGPGGVLYGANAFAGVVSVTTRDTGRSVSMSFGSDYTLAGAVGIAADDVLGGGLYAFADLQASQGWDPDLNTDGSRMPHPQHLSHAYGYVRHRLGDPAGAGRLTLTGSFTAHSYAERYRREGRNRNLERDPVYGAASYERRLDSGTLRLCSYLSRYDLQKVEDRVGADGVVIATDLEVFDTRLYGVEGELVSNFAAHEVVAGFAFQGYEPARMRVQDTFPGAGEPRPALSDPGASPATLGAFVQDLWRVGGGVNLISGLRYDHLTDFDDQVTVRFGVTTVRDHWFGKALLGTAYRVPSFREYLDILSYNLDLQPEKLRTLELQVGRRGGHGDASLTVYHNDYRDFIRELEVAAIGARAIGDEYAVNADRRRITGAEFQGNWLLTDHTHLRVGVGAVLSATETVGAVDPALDLAVAVAPGETDIPFVADVTAHLLASHRFRPDLQGALNVLVFSRRGVTPDYQQAVASADRDPANADAFMRVDVNGSWRIAADVELLARVENVFGAEIYSPPFGNTSNYDAIWPGRKLRVGFRSRF